MEGMELVRTIAEIFDNPKLHNRDRFILLAGHGSLLEYSLLHLFGYWITVEDIKNFRQVGSLTLRYPEYVHTTECKL